jgi:hypothetical protein
VLELGEMLVMLYSMTIMYLVCDARFHIFSTINVQQNTTDTSLLFSYYQAYKWFHGEYMQKIMLCPFTWIEDFVCCVLLYLSLPYLHSRAGSTIVHCHDSPSHLSL